ncbi:MAG: RND transporter [Planctomycetota bacterium]|nr:RND transporter [Planctomycetota bacterium]
MPMKLRWNVSPILLAVLACIVGCTSGSDDTASGTDKSAAAKSDEGKGAHSGWWCVEHGVPEGECSRCDSSLIAGFKAKGDWCEKHDLPESQCFKCDPKRAEKYIARYEAKYGKKPPEPTE